MKLIPSKIANVSAFMLVSTFFTLWLAVFMGNEVEAVLSYFLVFSFGIMHGANDLKLIQRAAGLGTRTFYFRALFSYLIVIGIIALFFSLVPVLALAFFILASAYHFGEQHWVSRISSTNAFSGIYYMAYGLIIFFLLFYFHADEVSGIIYDVTAYQVPSKAYLIGLVASGLIFLALFIWMGIKGQLITYVLEELFYLLLFYILFQSASLLWSFSIYFVIWHSIPSLLDQVQFLSGKITKATIWTYIRSSFIYWIASLIGLAVLYYFLKDEGKLFISVLIYFLAAITFPHVLVMNKLNKI